MTTSISTAPDAYPRRPSGVVGQDDQVVSSALERAVCGRAFLQMATRWAFDIGLHRVELQHSTRNVPSCRVAGKAGFSVEGTKRAAVLHSDGWHDMHLHGRVNDLVAPQA